MTKLLISVKNTEEALLSLACGADIVDLKDPEVGALGALSLNVTSDIVQAIHAAKLPKNNAQQVQISAAIGEQAFDLNQLILDIDMRSAFGVDIVKIAVSRLFYTADFLLAMQALSSTGVQLIAVYFADETIDFGLLLRLKQAGFLGAMLDTKNKGSGLLQHQTMCDLRMFTKNCRQYNLQSGLAGSLQTQYIDTLMDSNPTYIGFRGGVCKSLVRNSALCEIKVMEAKKMLLKRNNLDSDAQKTLGLALHS